MDFDAAITSHKLWKEAFLHYLMNHQGKIDVQRVEEHLNFHANKFGKILQMFHPSSVKLDIEFIEKTDNCLLGQWISEVRGMHKSNADITRLSKLHAHFHQLSAQIMREIERGDKKAALILLNDESEFSKVSTDIVTYITKAQHLSELGWVNAR